MAKEIDRHTKKSLRGADSTSAFAGKGKQAIYNLVKENLELVSEFKSLGTDYCIHQLPNLIENLVCKLYGSRFELFCLEFSLERSLPPTTDALFHHVKRCNYQTTIWKRNHLDRCSILHQTETARSTMKRTALKLFG